MSVATARSSVCGMDGRSTRQEPGGAAAEWLRDGGVVGRRTHPAYDAASIRTPQMMERRRGLSWHACLCGVPNSAV